MRDKIINNLREIEEKRDIKILLAIESGSRAWGFSSADSDYYVRFIYANKPHLYITVFSDKDTIESMSEDHLFDFSGWELRKTLQLLYKSNPNLSDWLLTDKTYILNEEFLNEIRALQNVYYNPLQALYHFYNIAKKHDEVYLSKNGYTLKRFLYYLRGLLACRYILKNSKHPPVLFDMLVEATVPELEIKKEIKELLSLKRKSKESDNNIVAKELMDYADQMFEEYKDVIPLFRPELVKKDSRILDSFLQKWIAESN